jgi:hypothetical protein
MRAGLSQSVVEIALSSFLVLLWLDLSIGSLKVILTLFKQTSYITETPENEIVCS